MRGTIATRAMLGLTAAQLCLIAKHTDADIAILRKPDCAAYETARLSKLGRARAGTSSEDSRKEALRSCVESLKRKLTVLDGVSLSDGEKTPDQPLAALLTEVKPETDRSILPAADSSVPQPREQTSRYIFRIHRLYQDIKRDDNAEPADKLLLKTLVHRLMDRLNLREPFAAALDTGITITDAGNAKLPYARSETDKLPFGMIDWESRHFFEHGRTDWSIGGRLGLLPTLALVRREDQKPDTPAQEEAPKPWPVRPLFHQAFHWDVNGRLSVHTGNLSELSFLARAGQSQLLAETQAVGTNEKPVSTSLIDNGPGRSAWQWDVGPEFRMFDNPLDIVHEDKTYHSPIFMIGGGLRKNSRFRRDGALTTFLSPEMRWFFRLSLSLNKIIDRRVEGADPKSLSVGFAVEHESPLRRGALDRMVPSGTRIVLTANFDVLSKLQRGSSKAK